MSPQSRTATLAGLLTAIAAVTASPASAQHAHVREGFWIGFGLGRGSISFVCDNCADHLNGALGDYLTLGSGGLSAHLKLGGSVNQHVLLGLDTNGWSKEFEGERLLAGNTSFVAYYYVQETGGLFLRGGIGLASLDLSDRGEYGLGLVLGVGLDVRIRPNMSVTPALNYNWGEPGDGLVQHELSIVVGLTWH